MILTRLYSNIEEKFTPIKFNSGLNIVLGEIRIPENMQKDTHNLGKSTLATLIDYCLLKEQYKTFFLFKHFDIFKEFIFFLELEYDKGQFLTIKRGVENNTKISFLKHTENMQNFTHLSDDMWTHCHLSIGRAKQILDSILNLEVVKPYDYRKPVSYALRSQDDYSDVFQLKKFVRHIQWKPYLAKVLGLNSELVQVQYELKQKYEEAKIKTESLKKELVGFTDSLDKLEGLILIKEQEADLIQTQLDEFNFEIEENNVNKELVYSIDSQLSDLNKERYYLTSSIEKLESSLNKHKIIFNPNEAKAIFEEAGVLFEGQIKKTYDELIEFNKEITKERQTYLKEELKEAKKEFQNIEEQISRLNKDRSTALYFLKDAGVMKQYKVLSNKMIKLDAEILTLKKQEEKLLEYDKAKSKKEKLKAKIDKNKISILENVKDSRSKDSVYSQIKLNFNAVVKSILDKEALISIDQNKEGNLEFKDEILDDEGNETSESDGKTYKKLLCIAFDIAVNQVYIDDRYTHFVYHDGFLEKLDNRKKINFIELIRKITKNNFQYIGTLIDSELPNLDKSIFKEGEIILTLHDDGDNGRLFKIPIW